MTQVTLDEQGRIHIPSTIRERLGLSQGMTLIVEEGDENELCLRVQMESPTLVNKQGVLVVKAEPLGDLAHVTRRERNGHASSLGV